MRPHFCLALTTNSKLLDQATSSMGDDWHLDRIAVSHLPSNRTWVFVLNNWVAKGGNVMQAQVWQDAHCVDHVFIHKHYVLYGYE